MWCDYAIVILGGRNSFFVCMLIVSHFDCGIGVVLRCRGGFVMTQSENCGAS